jgi:hypothetical protein
MNDIFDLTRFYRLVKADLFAFRKQYLFFVIFAASYAVGVFLLDHSSLKPQAFSAIVAVLVVLAPYVMYNDVYHKIKGVNYSMTPASNLEKWLAFWLQCVVIVPLLLGMLWLVIEGLDMALFPATHRPMMDIAVICKTTMLIICIQSVSMLGVMSFRRLKWLKTLGVVFLLLLGVLVISRLFMFNFDPNPALHCDILTDQTGGEWFLTHYPGIILRIVFPFGLWLASFFKLQEQEL